MGAGEITEEGVVRFPEGEEGIPGRR